MTEMLGRKVVHKITGIDLTIIGVAQYLFRSPQFEVMREGVDNDGRAWPTEWVDCDAVSEGL